MLIPKWDFRSEACLCIPDLKLHFGVLYWLVFTVRYFSNQGCWGCIQSIQPNQWDVEKVIQSSPVSYVDIWFIYMWCNSLDGSAIYKLILYTEIGNLSGEEFRISFQSFYQFFAWLFMVGTIIIPNIYLFIFFFFYLYVYLY